MNERSVDCKRIQGHLLKVTKHPQHYANMHYWSPSRLSYNALMVKCGTIVQGKSCVQTSLSHIIDTCVSNMFWLIKMGKQRLKLLFNVIVSSFNWFQKWFHQTWARKYFLQKDQCSRNPCTRCGLSHVTNVTAYNFSI